MKEMIKRRSRLVCWLVGMLTLGCASKDRSSGEEGTGVIPGKPDHGYTASKVYEMVPGAYPDTISLPDAIRGLKQDSAIDKLAKHVQDYVRQAVGIELVLPRIATIKDDPNRFTDMLQFTMEDLAAGRRVLLKGDIRPNLPAQAQNQLPQRFDYARAGSVPVTLPTMEPKEIIGGQIYQGYPRDPSIPDDVYRVNTILSEVFERLSVNLHVSADQRFTVVYRGVDYQSLDAFAAALVEAGHEITAEIRHQVANFTGLYARGADGALRPIASPAFTATGILDGQGKEAVLPMLHSEIIYRVRPTRAAAADAIEAAVAYYQGIFRMGFYADGSMPVTPWAGSRVSDRFGPKEAVEALGLTGHFTSVIVAAAEKARLVVHGYAVLGVCNDSVAIIQQAVQGKVNSWPLFMLDELVLPELEQRIASGQDVAAYEALRQAVAASPSDASENPTVRERALSSMSWEPGYEPFFSTIDARRILTGAK